MSYSPSSTSFPTSIDSPSSPSASSDTSTFDHAGLETYQNSAIAALEAKVGIDSSAVASSLDYKLTNASSANPGHTHTAASLSGVATSGANSNITSLSGLSTPLSVAQGGTGAATLTGILKGSGTSAITAVTAPSGAIVGDTDTQTLSGKTLTAPKFADLGYLADANGNEMIVLDTVASAVNYLFVGNSATGNGVTLTSSGDDSNVDLNISAKSDGKIKTTSAMYESGSSYSPSASGTATILLADGNNHLINMPAGNITIAISNQSVGQKFTIDILQDSVGSRTVTWFNASSQTVTMTIAAPGVVTSGTDIPTTTRVVFSTTGALPTGITAGTTYYWIRQSATTGNVATSLANAQAGTAITTTGSQSGTHTMVCGIRWTNDVVPTLSTGKYRHDSFGFWNIATNVILGYVIGQNI